MKKRDFAILSWLLCLLMLTGVNGAQAQQSIQFPPSNSWFFLGNAGTSRSVSVGSVCEQEAEWDSFLPISLSAADFSSNQLVGGITDAPQNGLSGRGWRLGHVDHNLNLETFSIVSANRDGHSVDPAYLNSRLVISNEVIYAVDYMDWGSYEVQFSGYSPSNGQTYLNQYEGFVFSIARVFGVGFGDIGEDGFLMPDPVEGIFNGSGLLTAFSYPVGVVVIPIPTRVTRDGLDVTSSTRNSILLLSGGRFSVPRGTSGTGFVVVMGVPAGSYEVEIASFSDCRSSFPESPVLRFRVRSTAQPPQASPLPQPSIQPDPSPTPNDTLQFAGPLVTRLEIARVRLGEAGLLTLHGKRLSSIRSATLGGMPVNLGPIIKHGTRERRQIVFTGLGRTGPFDLILETSRGRLTLARAVTVLP